MITFLQLLILVIGLIAIIAVLISLGAFDDIIKRQIHIYKVQKVRKKKS